MFRKVFLTFSTRVISALLSVINVLIGTNYLGVEGFGTISLIILGITMYLIIQNLISGVSIVYFTSRINNFSVISISYVWVFISIMVFTALLWWISYSGSMLGWNFEIVPREFIWENLILALSYGLLAVHLNLMLGRENIRAYNFITLLQHILSTFFLFILFVVMDRSSIRNYLLALFLSYFVSYLVALILTMRYLKPAIKPAFKDFSSMLRYGAMGQSANVLQFFNYRLGYYLLDAFAGRASLGIFSAATQVSEGLWILGKSISIVLLARISNSDDKPKARILSLKLLKFTAFITMMPLIILMFLPESAYTLLLGKDFYGVRSAIRWMAPGTLSLAASMMLSSYFSGSGLIMRNSIGSGIGVIFTVGLGVTLIPGYGIQGASLVSTLSYFSTFLYLLYHFRKEMTFGLRDLIISTSDILDSLKLLTSLVKKKEISKE